LRKLKREMTARNAAVDYEPAENDVEEEGTEV